MVWRLESMADEGLEGTVLGTLIMPYCSGLGNLLFVFLMAGKPSGGAQVVTNCLVNNVTNVTLLIGAPALFWGLTIVPTAPPRKKKNRPPDIAPRLNRLSLLFTMVAVLFFTGAAWAAARDRRIDFSEGLVLIGLFGFWQVFHVFDVLKNNLRENKKLSSFLVVDLLLLAVGAFGIYLSTDWLVEWLSSIKTGFISAKQLGWLSGWLMVLPNGLLAFYYAWRKQPEVVYASQVGDGHICIPLCLGLSALFGPASIPPFFRLGALILFGAIVVHFFFIAFFGRLPRLVGGLLCASYAYFVYQGLLG